MAGARQIGRARYRWSVTSRVLAAVAGGYALTSLLNIAAPLVLAKAGVNRPEALLATASASFLIYAAIIMAVFHARSAARAWIWLAVVAMPPAIATTRLLPEAVK
jgi:hypothetical protein